MPSVSAEPVERGERFVVGARRRTRAAGVAQARVLGADAGVVEPGGDRVRVEDLAVVVGEQRRARAVQHARRGRCRATRRPPPRRRSAARPRRRRSRRTCRSRSSRRRRRRRPPRAAGPRRRGSARAPRGRSRAAARARSPGTARGRRTSRSGSSVVSTFAIQSRIASLVASFSVRVPNSTGRTSAPSRPHPLDVRRLPPHVLAAHVDDALEPEARADGRGRDAVLAGAGLGDDPLLAEPPRDHRLAERVVQLVRAGVQQVLALQVDALVGREALGARERRGAARVVRQQLVQLGVEAVVVAQRRPGRVSSSSAGISVSGT